jgi:hypothetical protein
VTRHTPEQGIAQLRQAEAELAQAQALGMLDGRRRFLLDRRSSAPDTHAAFKHQTHPSPAEFAAGANQARMPVEERHSR